LQAKRRIARRSDLAAGAVSVKPGSDFSSPGIRIGVRSLFFGLSGIEAERLPLATSRMRSGAAVKRSAVSMLRCANAGGEWGSAWQRQISPHDGQFMKAGLAKCLNSVDSTT
jgi:hypothetical protein